MSRMMIDDKSAQLNTGYPAVKITMESWMRGSKTASYLKGLKTLQVFSDPVQIMRNSSIDSRISFTGTFFPKRYNTDEIPTRWGAIYCYQWSTRITLLLLF